MDIGLLPEWSDIQFAENLIQQILRLYYKNDSYLFVIMPSEQTQLILLQELLDGTDINEWTLYAERH